MKRPTKRDFLIGDDQFAKHYDRVGQITAMNKYIDYLEQQVKKCDLADVGGSLRELADKYEMDALNRYETSDHALSHIHMAAQARYGFEDGWEAAKKQ